jgi:hypothetical protein
MMTTLTGTGYKLFRLRADGSLGPLFINRRLRVEVGVVYPAEDHPTKGYAHRPGWHLAKRPIAPHLGMRGRVWRRVEFTGGKEHVRPAAQGGVWILARSMKVLPVNSEEL